ncbi:hypothetical protein RZS28_09615 [Methylocapsa polymorpha]|uniref:Uncharacterized protein n=1 Tax=Methylocapsa polymorpha TaxID=3080828 RepID=A0ABZ0HNB5_9HYPH|nr:hypothetical protein RZS28_09615 [Methylocapsa sp. RX1]
MQAGDFDETKATAQLPGLDIEIVHRRSLSGDAEQISISLLATPSFEAFGRFLEATNPFLFWTRFARMAWTPWLSSAPTSLPSKGFDHLPPKPALAISKPAREEGSAPEA